MRDGDPPQHLGEFPIMSRPEEEMPVIWHQAIGRDPYPGLGVGFSQNLLDRSIVSRLLEQREPPNSTVQDMNRRGLRQRGVGDVAWEIF
jgi:hypothetical protein